MRVVSTNKNVGCSEVPAPWPNNTHHSELHPVLMAHWKMFCCCRVAITQSLWQYRPSFFHLNFFF